jgi:hypothetical protein
VEWPGAIAEAEAYQVRSGAQASGKEEKAMMHSILVGAVFVAVVLVPYAVALFTGGSEESH